MYMNLARF